MKAVLIKPDMTITTIDLKEPLHKSAGEAVGGWIEVVRPQGLKHPYLMITNEEFLHLGLAENEIASYLYRTYEHGHPICGNVLIMKEIITEDQEHDVGGLEDPEAIKILQAMQMVKQLITCDVWRRGIGGIDHGQE